jgi:thiol-disulfide isomerase/thioredoxin
MDMKVNASLLFLCSLLLATPLAAEPVDFVLQDLQGKPRHLADYRGKWVLVNYWATWCPPCLEELPDLEVFYNKHKDTDAIVIGVNMEDIPLQQLRTFVEQQFLSFPILRGKPAQRTALGAIPAMPTSYLISPEGEVVARQVGIVSGEMIERFIANYGLKRNDR